MVSKNKTNPMIFAQDGPFGGKSWTLASELLIGRDDNCDIQISDRQVSRQHAKFCMEKNGHVELIDLNSKNGVFLNGDRINKPEELHDGDVIKIALIQEFMFISSDATIPLDIALPQQEESSQKLFIDHSARRVWIGDKELLPPLSVQQYKLLTVLYDSEGMVVPRDTIIHEVWGMDAAAGVTEQALDALVRRLRNRLKKKDPTHTYVSTIRGVGFQFNNIQYKS